LTEASFLGQMADRSQERIRDLSRVGGSSLSSGCFFASRHPGWLIAAGFAATFLVGRLVLPRLPGAGSVRGALGVVGRTLGHAVSGRLLDALVPRDES